MMSFDMIPTHDEGVIYMASDDLGRIKDAKFKKAVSASDLYKVHRYQNQIVIEYLKVTGPNNVQVKARMIYELLPQFAQR